MATARHAGDVTRDRRKYAGEALARRATLDTRGRAPRRATGDARHSVAVPEVRGRVSCVTRRVPPRLRARSNGVADDHVRARTKKVEAVPRRRESRAARAGEFDGKFGVNALSVGRARLRGGGSAV